MPRRETATTALNRWVRVNTWVRRPEHAPRLQIARLIAEAADAERAAGKVQAATANAFRQACNELERLAETEAPPTPAPAPAPTAAPAPASAEPDADLFGPRRDLPL